MASYEFECRACGEHFQVNVPMSQHENLKANPPTCPKCASHETRQLVSRFSSRPASSYWASAIASLPPPAKASPGWVGSTAAASG